MGIFDFFKKNKNIENDNGLNETYFHNGNIRERYWEKNGFRDGLFQEYDYDNKETLRKEGNYQEGEKIGKWKEFYKSGKLHSISDYNHKYRIFYEEYFEHNGSIKKKVNKKENRIEYYYESGELESEELDDWMIFYYKSGEIQERQQYSSEKFKELGGNQSLIKLEEYYEDGKISKKLIPNTQRIENNRCIDVFHKFKYYDKLGNVIEEMEELFDSIERSGVVFSLEDKIDSFIDEMKNY